MYLWIYEIHISGWSWSNNLTLHCFTGADLGSFPQNISKTKWVGISFMWCKCSWHKYFTSGGCKWFQMILRKQILLLGPIYHLTWDPHCSVMQFHRCSSKQHLWLRISATKDPRKKGLTGPKTLLNLAHPAFSRFNSSWSTQQADAKKGPSTWSGAEFSSPNCWLLRLPRALSIAHLLIICVSPCDSKPSSEILKWRSKRKHCMRMLLRKHSSTST